MKRILATLGACAIAVSMFAFAGCGEKSGYTEKSADEMVEILKGIDTAKVLNLGDKNLGLTVEASGEFAYGTVMSGNGSASAKLDLKLGENFDLTAAGEASAKASVSYKPYAEEPAREIEVDLTGKAYVENSYVYAEAEGTLPFDEELEDATCKFNYQQVLGAVMGSIGNLGGSVSLVAAEESAPVDPVQYVLALASQVGVKFYVDNSDGLKVKVSATQDTVFGVLDYVASQIEDEEAPAMIAEIKKSVTFNKFQFDVYFSLDKDGVFSEAGIDLDVDVKVAGELIQLISKSETAAPDFTAKAKLSVKLNTHNNKVTVPAGLAEDEKYYDITEEILHAFNDSDED